MYRNHLEKLLRTRLDDILVDEGVLDRERLDAAQAQQDQSGKLLSDVLIDSGTVDEWDLAKLVAGHYALPFVDVKLYSIPGPVLDLLPLPWCREHSLLPIDQFGKSIAVVCVETPTLESIEEIIEKTGCTVFLYVGVRRAMREVIDEALKRRGNRTAIAASAARAVAVAAGQSPSLVPSPAPTPAAAAQPHAPEETPLPALDLPRISLQLNASAGSLAHGVHGAAVFGGHDQPAVAKKPQFDRGVRPAPAAAQPAAHAAPAVAPVPQPVAPAASPPTSPVVAQKVSPIQQLLGRAPAAPNAPVVPAAPAPASARLDDSPRPKLGSRAAPVLPSPATAPETPQPKAAAPGQTGWESIFDIGDDAVHRTPEAKRKSRV
ncbi:MAG: hypothetical protein K8T90_16640 [Planctomycetes bacterium]|nr:hypothetical protein [Planctomycetota bacterium]